MWRKPKNNLFHLKNSTYLNLKRNFDEKFLFIFVEKCLNLWSKSVKFMKTIAIIVAGGSGTRFGGDVPKQFALLAGRPVLMRSIEAIDRALAGADHSIKVVLSKALWPQWGELKRKFDFNVEHALVDGGMTRYGSVYNALMSLSDVGVDEVVLVHDAARPLVPAAVVREVALAAGQSPEWGVVPVVPLTDSVRRVDTYGGSVAVDRASLRAVQTPQGFNAGVLMKAYALTACKNPSMFTDDASVFEEIGGRIRMVDGDRDNIKITYPADLLLAEQILKERQDA